MCVKFGGGFDDEFSWLRKILLHPFFKQGELQNKDFELSSELMEQLISATPKGVKPEVLITLYKYYIANKQDNTDWVILPVTNFDAYFGTTAFGRRCLQLLKEANIIETETGYGVSRYTFHINTEMKWGLFRIISYDI